MSEPSDLSQRIDAVASRDRGRLLGQWRRLQRDGGAVDSTALEKLRRTIDASIAAVAIRDASVPELSLDESLPITAKADDIVKLIERNQVVILAGETGSGKTTQLPKLCLAAGRGRRGLIGCTQPRRIAARSVARRVAEELGTSVGQLVGFQVRFTEQVGDVALIKFMTDGILLAETQRDPWLSTYDTIILDEAHERSLNIDFLLGYLKRLLAKRSDLKLIVTSATIDTSRFAEHFGDAPVVEVEGRAFPVDVCWRPPDGKGESNIAEQVVAAIDEITAGDPRGDTLIFLPGEREIRDVHLALSRRKYRETEVVALYARLSATEQDRVFKPGLARRIVLATNVAETSLTVPRIRYVVDTGTARVKRYGARSQLERLHIEPISQAAADQRKGRCGRIGPGTCYRLYSEDDYLQRSRYTDPEILRSSLAGVILRMLSLKLGDVVDFPFVEAPDDRAIGDGYRRLAEIGAIDDDKRLTHIGQQIARIPVDVALARMLVEAKSRDVLREALIVVSFLSIQDPRERPADARAQADAAHALFADPKSDFVGVLRLWTDYSRAHEDFTQSKLRDWCKTHYLSFLRMREWRELHRQLLVLEGDMDRDASLQQVIEYTAPESRPPRSRRRHVRSAVAKTEGSNATVRGDQVGDGQTDSINAPTLPPDRYESLHRCLISGWPTQVGIKDERSQYRGTRERKFQIFPGSSTAKSPPAWLLAGQIIDIGKIYAMNCARIEPAWVEQQAAHLIRKTWRDPHWSRKRGAVLAFEQVNLFGLNLAEKRHVQFAKQDPSLAHEIFVREALTRSEIDCRADFARANARVLAQAHELEAKQRRSNLLRSDSELEAFFKGKLPADISTTAALDAWYRNAAPAEQAALRWSLGDVLAGVAGASTHGFPAALAVKTQSLRYNYRFVPGDLADGVTLNLPLAFVNAVTSQQGDWLVPGLLAEKVAELIRGLPKSLRRNFVPAPDFANAFIEAAPDHDQALVSALAAYLFRVTGVEISARDFATIELPVHLKLRYRVFDEDGRTIAEGRDLDDIQAQWSGAARAAFSQRADAELVREEVDQFDFEDLPDTVVSSGGLTAFPALVDLGETVALRVFERRDEAIAEHVAGVDRLLHRALADRIKQAQRQLPVNNTLMLKWAGFGSAAQLRSDVVEAALRECLAAQPRGARTRETFEKVKTAIARDLFPTAIERLKVAEAIIEAHADFTPWLEAPLMGFAKANYDDLREQRDELLFPGFLRELPAGRLQHYPRYLRAMRLRGERLRQDPAKDQARMLQVQLYWRAYLKHRASANSDKVALDDLRWLVEELRVSVFAQELRTAEPVSPKRLSKAVEALDED